MFMWFHIRSYNLMSPVKCWPYLTMSRVTSYVFPLLMTDSSSLADCTLPTEQSKTQSRGGREADLSIVHMLRRLRLTCWTSYNRIYSPGTRQTWGQGNQRQRWCQWATEAADACWTGPDLKHRGQRSSTIRVSYLTLLAAEHQVK